jgi:hypothetical protein
VSISQDRAVEILFEALSEHGQDALRELRDGSERDSGMVWHWARRWYIESPAVREFAEGVISMWSDSAKAAAQLRCQWKMTFEVGNDDRLGGGYDGTEERDWIESHKYHLVPLPWESLREWRLRADAIYHELMEIRGGKKPMPVNRDTLERYATWFVLYQVNGHSVPEIVEELPYEIEASTVNKGVTTFRKYLNIETRPQRKRTIAKRKSA